MGVGLAGVKNWVFQTACIHSHYLVKCNDFTNFQWTLQAHMALPSYVQFMWCAERMAERFECWRVFLVVYMFLCLASACGEIWLNLIRFAYIDCACTHPFLSRKSSTWHCNSFTAWGKVAENCSISSHKAKWHHNCNCISSKLLFVFICGKTFVHWQVHR